MDNGTLLRTTVLLIALFNNYLVMVELHPLPFSNEQIYEGISALFTASTSLWAWFKNNYITKFGKEQRLILEENGVIKRGEKADF